MASALLARSGASANNDQPRSHRACVKYGVWENTAQSGGCRQTRSVEARFMRKTRFRRGDINRLFT